MSVRFHRSAIACSFPGSIERSACSWAECGFDVIMVRKWSDSSTRTAVVHLDMTHGPPPWERMSAHTDGRL